MKSFADYVNEAGVGGGPQKAKWIIDKKQRGNVILKAGSKMLFKMCKYSEGEYSVSLVYATKRKVPGKLFNTFKQAMDHVDFMFANAFTEKYDVEPMSKDVQAWLEKCVF